ncbi:hypothetical protein KI387_008234 [Taxus chinensis]|uniref:Uncharacterized protein n=1 Tax=Taxus chinensis TaxID=29808 RepID=A0AA38CNN5_TAXCH|nr:hypothetical protein KI387_008234 [Taxus chinensis]
MIRCGRLSVAGEAEEIIPISQTRQRHTKPSSNPYSSRGLEKFARLKAELSARREYVARKTGTPEAMVKFADSGEGWVPVIVKNGFNGGQASILPPIRTKEDNQRKENYNSTQKDEENVEEADERYEDGVNGSASREETLPVTMPWWSGYLKATAIGVLIVSTTLLRKPAAAMAVAMVVGFLQKLWLGGVMCMKRFIDTGISYFSENFPYWKRNPKIKTSFSHGGSVHPLTAPCSPARGQATVVSALKNSSRRREHNTQLDDIKKKKFQRKPKADGSMGRKWEGKGTTDPTVAAIVGIVLLFFLVFYGRLSAICFTSAWWYVLPKFRSDEINAVSNNKNRMMVDLQTREYMKKVYH